jgi:hypothetical protein
MAHARQQRRLPRELIGDMSAGNVEPRRARTLRHEALSRRRNHLAVGRGYAWDCELAVRARRCASHATGTKSQPPERGTGMTISVAKSSSPGASTRGNAMPRRSISRMHAPSRIRPTPVMINQNARARSPEFGTLVSTPARSHLRSSQRNENTSRGNSTPNSMLLNSTVVTDCFFTWS